MENLVKFPLDRTHNNLICIPHSEYSIKCPEIEDTPSFDFGNSLAKIYPVLDLVFEYLPYKDLYKAKCACKSWEEIADGMLKKRKRTFKKPGLWVTTKEKDLIRSSNLHFSKHDFGLIFFRHKVNNYGIIPKVCSHQPNENIEIDYIDYIKQNYFEHRLDRFALVRGSDVFFSPSTENVATCAGIFIPEIPGVRITTFQGKKSLKLRNDIKEDEKVVALFILTTDTHYHKWKPKIKEVIEEIKESCNPNLAFAGGAVTWVFSSPTKEGPMKKSKVVYGIQFLRSQSSETDFAAYSFILDEREDSCTIFSQLKEQVNFKTNSLAIMIICCARNGKKHDVQMFNLNFPKVPLIAIDSNGEFGWNSEKGDCCNYGATWKPSVIHSYAISILILTWDTKDDLRKLGKI